MTTRFSLRFVSGDRAGEVCPLEASRVTLGRLARNSLQVTDSSISGSHAEFLVGENSVILKDCDSTNGTKIGGTSIKERELAHGDEMRFGSVVATFLDAELADSVDVEFSEDVGGGAGEAVASLSAGALEEKGSNSRTGFLVAVAAILLVGAGAYYGVSLFEPKGGVVIKQVAVVPGDLLGGSGSFEEGLGDWSNDEDAAAEFLSTVAAAVTGESGMQVVLVEGERARLASGAVDVRAGESFEARASLMADKEVGARLGLLFSGGAGQLSSTAWSAVVEGEGTVSLTAITPPGHDKVALVVEALAVGEGMVRVDDASLLPSDASSQDASVAGFGFHLLGEPHQSLCVTKISAALIGGFEVEGATLEGSRTEIGMELTASAAGALQLDVAGSLVESGVASLGEGGYQVHGASFDREDVTTLLLGKGNELIALHMDAACSVRARPRGEGMHIVANLKGAKMRLQVHFIEERKQAGDLAYSARGAEREGRLGDCLVTWEQLLQRYPYQEGLVVEAEGVRGRLVQAGLLKLQEVRAEIERAAFFRLVGLYRSCHDQAAAVGAQYAGSEVEEEAQALMDAVAAELDILEVDLDASEVARLRSIHRVLEATNSGGLAEAVAQYLDSEFSVNIAQGGE